MRNSLRHFFHHLFGARFYLHIGAQNVTLSQTSIGWKKPLSVLINQPLIENQLKEQCDTVLANSSCTALPLLITLNDVWGRLFIVTPPKNVTQFSDLIAAATMRFHILYGKDNDEWEIEAAWQIDRPFLACAYPRSLLNTLRQTAKEHNHLLLSIQPYFITAWNHWHSKLKMAAWFGVVQDDVVTIGIVSESTAPSLLIGIRSFFIHGHTTEWMAEQLNRIALQNNVALPQKIQLIGNVHGYWKNSSDKEQLIINLEEPLKNLSQIKPTISSAMRLALSRVWS